MQSCLSQRPIRKRLSLKEAHCHLRSRRSILSSMCNAACLCNLHSINPFAAVIHQIISITKLKLCHKSTVCAFSFADILLQVMQWGTVHNEIWARRSCPFVQKVFAVDCYIYPFSFLLLSRWHVWCSPSSNLQSANCDHRRLRLHGNQLILSTENRLSQLLWRGPVTLTRTSLLSLRTCSVLETIKPTMVHLVPQRRLAQHKHVCKQGPDEKARKYDP